MWRKIIRNPFFWGFFCAATIIGGTLLSSEKLSLHQQINTYNSSFGDAIFPYITHLGDGIFAGLLIILLFLFVSIRTAAGLLISFGLSGITAQLLKKLIYYPEMRPLHFFRELSDFHFVDGVALHLEHSFPSGHATSAFAVFGFLALINKSSWLQFLFFVLAALGAFSRVYLSQHFLADVFAGMMIGTVFAVLAYIVSLKFIPESYEKGLVQLKKA